MIDSLLEEYEYFLHFRFFQSWPFKYIHSANLAYGNSKADAVDKIPHKIKPNWKFWCWFDLKSSIEYKNIDVILDTLLKQ